MKSSTIAVGFVASLLCATTVHAQTLAALVDGDGFALINATNGKLTNMTKISGAPGPLVGIDIRPADGMLYGLTGDGTVVTIDPASGKATVKSKLDTMVPAGTAATMDFNPVADRLRVIGTDGTNLRANVDDGKVTKDGMLKFADADMHKGQMPMVVAGAYTNSTKGAKETALYDIDARTGALVKQAPPNDGVLGSIGMLGIDAKKPAFDIASDAAGSNTGWLVSGTTLYRVDLSTGKASQVANVTGLTGAVRKITVLPPA